MDSPTTILINNSVAVIANINNVELGSILYVFTKEDEPHKYEVIKRGKASFRVAELINDEKFIDRVNDLLISNTNRGILYKIKRFFK